MFFDIVFFNLDWDHGCVSWCDSERRWESKTRTGKGKFWMQEIIENKSELYQNYM